MTLAVGTKKTIISDIKTRFDKILKFRLFYIFNIYDFPYNNDTENLLKMYSITLYFHSFFERSPVNHISISTFFK